MTAAACPVLVIMGVSACGKTVVGRTLASRLGGRFVDGDDHHPADNVAKMAAGSPLGDVDRWPWLDRLHAILAAQFAGDSPTPLVVACSALARRYRDRLRGGLPLEQVRFVHLATDFDTILGRLDARQGHFMKGRPMLEDQFGTLEPLAPDELAAGSLVLDASNPVEAIVERIAVLTRPAINSKFPSPILRARRST
jgi:gluconokinase